MAANTSTLTILRQPSFELARPHSSTKHNREDPRTSLRIWRHSWSCETSRRARILHLANGFPSTLCAFLDWQLHRVRELPLKREILCRDGEGLIACAHGKKPHSLQAHSARLSCAWASEVLGTGLPLPVTWRSGGEIRTLATRGIVPDTKGQCGSALGGAHLRDGLQMQTAFPNPQSRSPQIPEACTR